MSIYIYIYICFEGALFGGFNAKLKANHLFWRSPSLSCTDVLHLPLEETPPTLFENYRFV